MNLIKFLWILLLTFLSHTVYDFMIYCVIASFVFVYSVKYDLTLGRWEKI